MKIAFPTRDYRAISGHFGKMKSLLVLDVVDGVEIGREQRDMSGMPMCGDGHGEKPRFVTERLADCDVLIAGGMGMTMVDRIEANDTELVLTDIRMIDKALSAYLSGSIEHKPQLAHGPRSDGQTIRSSRSNAGPIRP